ncbi:cellulose biosynthesis cyclic di-GMP-binding regulatory protein BcsB [Vibrio nitrifigilis]|uniref:Cyclic di-GMP-binding protein n=1 Tax=Vibrio nitrifigilis TaxID=2789781 RepID=A0ABS0GG72_9VIBR|nr:cellulose biosynthesis cyclic di-GMP-binding regulatory protein BcsB [Vibrio nitrifigilis]MBF9001423.1 cellulose biosynthesis cyclic di-GMP-binding regulatory protein BcsB [Vibrio nitrifigilis]
MMGQLKSLTGLLCLLCILCQAVYAKNLDSLTSSSDITFSRMGLTNGITFTGGQKDAGLEFRLPIDTLVSKAQLVLDLKTNDTISDSLSSLAVMVNGQSVGAIPLNSVNNKKTTYELNVPALLVTSSNKLSFKIVGTDDQVTCINDDTASTIHMLPSSMIKLDYRPLNIAADLHPFPQPFWDSHEMLGRDVTFVFANNVNSTQVSAASILASWLGIHASYRGVDFHALKGQLPDSNGIVFGKPGQTIGSLTLPKTAKPLLKVIPNPVDANYKLLLVVGESESDLRSAVYRLAQGNFALHTAQLEVKRTSLPQSKPYDAPRWIPTDKPVLLKDLIQDGQSMHVKGVWHNAVNFNFRAAPDLFLWNGKTIPLNLHYRFPSEPWIDEDNSFLNVVLNDQFLEDLMVNKQGYLEGLWRSLGIDTRQEKAQIGVQPYMLYGDNQLSLYFNLHAKPDTPCDVKYGDNITSLIDDDSSLDLRGARHFSFLPNLSFFIGASFPYSRLADYSETVLLLPTNPTAAQLQTMLGLSARAGASTGKMIVRVQTHLGYPAGTNSLKGKNVLAVSSLNDARFVDNLLKRSPFSSTGQTLHVKPESWYRQVENWLKGDFHTNTEQADRYLSSNRNWRGFLSFESPWQDGKVVIAAVATSDKELVKLHSDLNNSEINAGIRGDLAVITDNSGVHSFQTSEQFATGQVSWYEKLIWYASQYSSLFAIFMVLFSLFLGMVFFRLLNSHARNRLK